VQLATVLGGIARRRAGDDPAARGEHHLWIVAKGLDHEIASNAVRLPNAADDNERGHGLIQ
jgi:hypothetical protein